MKYNMLGKTGLKVSQIGLGAMNFEKLGKETAFTILDKARDLGITLIDTANSYSGSEQIVGDWMASRDCREEFVISTKVGWPVGDLPNDRGLSRPHITRELDRSLDRLQTDYIDIYQAHYYDGQEDLFSLVKLFSDLVAHGQVSSIGAPTFTRSYYVVSWHHIARQYGLTSIGSKLMTTSLLSRGMFDGDTRHLAKDYGIGLITFAALGGGLLTGKYHSALEFPENGKEMFRDIVTAGKIDAIVDRLQAMATELETTPAKISMAWVLSHGFMDSVIVGASSDDQLVDILDSRELDLTESQIKELTVLSNQNALW